MLKDIKDKFEDVDEIYKWIGLLGLFQVVGAFITGIVSGPSSLFVHEYFKSSKILYFFEILLAVCYIIPVLRAFIHDLCFEERPKHLIIAMILELIILVALKFFKLLGGNLLMFIGAGIVLCFLIGGSAFGLVLFFDWLITGGLLFLAPLLGFLGPLFVIGLIVSTIAELFA